MKKYELTEEHKKELKPWAEKWIGNALSCKPMDQNDKDEMVKAINGMYESANLPKPKNIVFVSSPFIMRFAGGFAAAIWHIRKSGFKPNDATDSATDSATRDATNAATRDATNAATRDATGDSTRDATDSATRAATYVATYAATGDATIAATRDATGDSTRDATDSATRAATYVATYAATGDATIAATRDATIAATYAATDDATNAATRDATGVATYAATDSATHDATYDVMGDAWYNFPIKIMKKLSWHLGLFDFGLSCAVKTYNMWQGGNQWSGWAAFLSFFRHIAKLSIDYSKWEFWEKATIHGGPRIMHPDFCMVSDRPLYIKQDSQNRPHCFDGPFCEWRDGSKLYSIHGVRVPEKYILTPADKIDPKEVLSEPNAEVRTAVIKKCGFAHFKKHLPTKLISTFQNNELLEFDLGNGMRVRGLLVRWTDKHDSKETVLPVPRTREQFEKTGDIPDDINDCEQVRRWTLFSGKEENFLQET